MLYLQDKMYWHLFLPAFLLSFRMIRQKFIKHSPFEVPYGQNPLTPFNNYLTDWLSFGEYEYMGIQRRRTTCICGH